MKKVFFVRHEAGRPYMLVTVKPGSTMFQPLSDDADEVCDVLENVFKNRPINKTQLDAALDEDFSIEGPVVVTRDTTQIIKEFMSSSEKPRGKQIDISAIKIKDLGEDNARNLLNVKARAFIYEQTKSTFNYEVKRVRAIWDPSLSIPGGRRGGWRCPTGTRYGGQITDRFGRNCGWGVARRIANAITNIGERLEGLDDRRRGRRADRRNQRVMRRLRRDERGGAAERGLRGIAEVLDPSESTAKPKTPEAPKAPKAPEKPRGRRRVFDSDARDAGLRDSEQRRVRREIEEPGAARTGEIDLDDTVELPAGESAPDSRSFRNVNNRFPKNGLPDDAYWRRDSYTGSDKAELERRFGRYYDKDGKINQRGKFVNERLDDFRKRKAAPKKKPEPRKKPRGKRKPSERPKGAVEGPLDGESFNDYADRKYDEYRKRVEQIQRDGGNAGLLTKKEWFDVNQGNLREAWGKKNPEKKKPAPRKKPEPRVKPPVAEKEPTPNRRADTPLAIDPGAEEAKNLFPKGWFKDLGDDEQERLENNFVEAFINEGQNITQVLGDGHRYGEGTPGQELLADWQADPDGEMAARAKYVKGQIADLQKEEQKLLEQVTQLKRKGMDDLDDIGRRALARKAGRHARIMHERQRLQDILDNGIDNELRARKGPKVNKTENKKPRKLGKKDVFDNSIQAVSYEGAAKRIDELPDDWAGAGNAEEMRDSLRKLAARLAKYDKDDLVELENGEEVRVEDLAKNVLDAADAWDRFAKRERDNDEQARRAEIADILENQRADNRPAQPDNQERIEQLIEEENEIERALERADVANFGANAKNWQEAYDGFVRENAGIGMLRQNDDIVFRDNWNAEDAELRNQFEKEMEQIDLGNVDAEELRERIAIRQQEIDKAKEQMNNDLKRIRELEDPKNADEFAEKRAAIGRMAANERRVNLMKQFNKENREILGNLRDAENAREERDVKKPRVVNYRDVFDNSVDVAVNNDFDGVAKKIEEQGGDIVDEQTAEKHRDNLLKIARRLDVYEEDDIIQLDGLQVPAGKLRQNMRDAAGAWENVRRKKEQARAANKPDNWGDGSAPDDRSFRNVNNFFPKGLPDRPFWRDNDYDKPNKESLEKRFGRYYDDENKLTQRGKYVNDKLKKMGEEGKLPPVNRRRGKRPPNSDIKRVVKFEEIDKNEGISVGDAIAHIGFRDEDDRVIDALAEKFGIPTRDTQRQRESGVGRVNMVDVGEIIRERIERNKKERWNPREKQEFGEKLAKEPDDVLDIREQDADRAVDQAEDKVRTALEDLARIRRQIKERKGSLKRLRKDDKKDLQMEAERLIVWNGILLEKRARLKMVQDEIQKRNNQRAADKKAVGNFIQKANTRQDFDAILGDISKMVPASQPNRPLPREVADKLFDAFQRENGKERGEKYQVVRDRIQKQLDNGNWDDKLKEQRDLRKTVLDGRQRNLVAARQRLENYVNRVGFDERDNDLVDRVRQVIEAEAEVRQMQSQIDQIDAREKVVADKGKGLGDYGQFITNGGMELEDVPSDMLKGDANDDVAINRWFKEIVDKAAKKRLDEYRRFPGGAVFRLPNGKHVFLTDNEKSKMREWERLNNIPPNRRAKKIQIVSAIEAPERPREKPLVKEKALETAQRGPVGLAFPRRENKAGNLGVQFGDKGIGEYKPVNNAEIKNEADAIKWVADGGSLSDVPHEFWHAAVEANSSEDKWDDTKRFRLLSANGGAIGITRIYVLRDEEGYGTNHGIVFKAADAGDNIAEAIGWNYMDRLGILDGGAVYDGMISDTRKGTKRAVIVPFAFKDIPEGNNIGKNKGGDNFVLDQAKADPLQAIPGRVHNWLLNYMLGVADRHPGNGFLRRVANVGRGDDKVHVVPLDLGWAGRAGMDDPIRFIQFGNLGMDSRLLETMARLYGEGTPEVKERIVRDLTRAIDNVIEKTEQVLDVPKDVFVRQALKNVPENEKNSAIRRAESIYENMKRNLDGLKRRRQAIIDKVTR